MSRSMPWLGCRLGGFNAILTRSNESVNRSTVLVCTSSHSGNNRQGCTAWMLLGQGFAQVRAGGRLFGGVLYGQVHDTQKFLTRFAAAGTIVACLWIVASLASEA